MVVATRPQSGRSRPSRARRGQGALETRGDARATGEVGGWPPRWLTPVPFDDISRGEGDLVADFIENHCRISKDSIAGPKGEPLRLRPWQREALRHIFARRPDGRRRHRTALYSTPRKNGKTELAAGIALYGLTMEAEGAEVYSCAADRDQAKLVFGAAKRMIEMDPELSTEVRPYRDVLEHISTGSVYRALSSESFTKEGLSPTLVVYDELHAAPDGELYHVMDLAMGARRDPLMLIVTTAGVMSNPKEDETTCFQKYQWGQRVATGQVDDAAFFMAWWGAESEEADHRDESVWHLANPGLGDILDIEDMRDKVTKTPESEFRTKRLNLWVPSEEFWLPYGEWEKCAGSVKLDPKLPICVGIDIGLVSDNSAVVISQRQGEKVAVQARVWQNPHPPDSAAHRDWLMPLDELVQYLRDLRRLYPASAARINDIAVPGPAYVYDKWGLASTELALERERGYALIPVPQQGGWMVEASRRFYEAVLEHRIVHDPSHEWDSTLAAHLRHVVPRQVGESGWRLEKPSKARKIDAAVAAVMSVSQALEGSPKRFQAFAA